MTTRSTYVAVVALAVLALLAYMRYGRAAGTDPASYVTVVVDRGPIKATVVATGTVNPVQTVQVGTYVSGPIQALYADFNSQVTKGQRVAKIDPASFLVKVHEAEANVANSSAQVRKDRANLALMKLLFDRNRTLLARQLVAQNDLDTARSNYDQAVAQLALDEAGVKQAEASLDEAEVNLRYTDILSPVDGVVVSRSVDVGQTVAASFQTPTLFLIAGDLTKMQVDTNVSESDVGQEAEGQAATFTVDAYPGQPFHGRVSQVRNAPITVQNVVTYDVVIAVDNPDLKLKPGMTANVSITTAQRENALRIPLRALRFRPDQPATSLPATTAASAHRSSGPSGVFVLGPSGLRRVELETGIRDGQHVEVVRGDLDVGEQVVTGIRRESEATRVVQRPPGFAGGRRF